MIDGIININKEKGRTSFFVVKRLKRILAVDKIGHTGTLDPDATGVLPVCLGRATKLVDYLMNTDKTYKATMVFGISTDTQDISGTIAEQMDIVSIYKKIGILPLDQEANPVFFTESSNADFLNVNETQKAIAKEKIMDALNHFKGEILQLPPMYSAIKVNGVKLVNAARKGQEIERVPRKTIIYEYSNISFSEDMLHLSFEVRCSKGTYIRTLCQDIGEYLGLPACLEQLERTETSGLKICDSISIEEVEKLVEEGKIEEKIIPTDYFLQEYEKIVILDDVKQKVIYGNYLRPKDTCLDRALFADGNIYRIYDADGKFYALYKYYAKDNFLKVEKMFV